MRISLILFKLVLVFAACSAAAQSFQVLGVFNYNNGGFPNGSLVQGTNGNFFGTTQAGGAHGKGTVFEITPGGKLTILYNFCGQAFCGDGGTPFAGLALASDGNFYGTTSQSGKSLGTIYRITAAGVLTTLHHFGRAEGYNPYSRLIQGTDGNLYGTTTGGGANGWGTIYKITLSGAFSTLHSFDKTNGATPYAGLIEASDGNFYGTTPFGGINSIGLGTLYRISSDGVFTKLWDFGGTSQDGYEPVTDLVQASDGNLYGTTLVGGRNGTGTVFTVTLAGVLSTLVSFNATGTDGAGPYGTLIQASDGNLWGTTSAGGIPMYDSGTIFKTTLNGQLNVMHLFQGTDGARPQGALLQASDGSLYGTTVYGGLYTNDGLIFRLSPGS